jgi:D-sedoheptulose 7-phosphate isomerase
MSTTHDYVKQFLTETQEIAAQIDQKSIVQAINLLQGIKNGNGRLFILGVGGSAGNASHAVNDFRKIANIETYAPTDNVSELTAWVNDSSWEVTFINWLKTSRLKPNDLIMVLSVGGGSATTSLNLVRAMEYGQEVGAKIISIVSRDGGRAKQLSDVCILVPVVSADRITPHAESWQAVIWHMMVNVLT